MTSHKIHILPSQYIQFDQIAENMRIVASTIFFLRDITSTIPVEVYSKEYGIDYVKHSNKTITRCIENCIYNSLVRARKIRSNNKFYVNINFYAKAKIHKKQLLETWRIQYITINSISDKHKRNKIIDVLKHIHTDAVESMDYISPHLSANGSESNLSFDTQIVEKTEECKSPISRLFSSINISNLNFN